MISRYLRIGYESCADANESNEKYITNVRFDSARSRLFDEGEMARARESETARDSERQRERASERARQAASGRRQRAHVHDDEAGALQHVRVVEALVALEAARARLRQPVRFAARRLAGASPAARRPLVPS